ncbi:STM4015 family protein [Actinomadura sp. NBRC 104412]|uniref:STM4015 family protein n=1 Tax=Actinomadura sp. NBRC 104412 TaxID=3032203 RepID=UPI00255746CB|nr:STM4015 family protein [Actinomadura sp. NBRC 104412]
MINEYLTEFAGLPVKEFTGDPGEDGFEGGALADPSRVAWRVGYVMADDGALYRDFLDNFARFLDLVDTARVTHLVIGWWEYDHDPVEVLSEAAGDLPNLRALFLGDILDWELHISWIEQSDLTPLFQKYPSLEHVEARGGQGLTFEPMRHERLRTVRFESGGLPAEAVQGVARSDLPALEHLDLWLGAEDRGRTATLDDLGPVLTGERFPALRRLGLQNADIQDEVAAAIASAPVVARLESLALSMGALSDRGAEALLTGQPLTHLKDLDLHHAFLSEDMVERIRKALPGVSLDLTDATGAATWLRRDRVWDSAGSYIAVSE